MKKILKSVFVIFVSLGLVTAATRAFFSDTETSVGNRFVAGAIDLKVDSEGHYNGMDCVENKWSDCTSGQETTVVISDTTRNGGFESPEVPGSGSWEVYPSGTAGLEWTVEWAEAAPVNPSPRPDPALQELQEGVSGWLAHGGNQWTELDSDWDAFSDEPALVRIYQDVPTTEGSLYKLTYWYSPRPGTADGENMMDVEVNSLGVDSKDAGAGSGQTNWTEGVYEFTASSATTRIGFVGRGANNSFGMFLDDVRLVEVERVCTPNPEYEGMSCDPNWELKDLTVTDQFFDFSDLKPGDFGENTISLHVYNNDAYMCMNTSNYSDLEVTPGVEPETEAGDLTIDPGLAGDLSQHLDFFAWYDDGDNVWEKGEVKITSEPVAGNVFLNNWSYGLYTPQGQVMPQSSTKYIGLAWCFGNMGGVDTFVLTCDGADQSYNEAQTDQVLADIGFYVEQARNNEGFSCANRQLSVTPIVQPE